MHITVNIFSNLMSFTTCIDNYENHREASHANMIYWWTENSFRNSNCDVDIFSQSSTSVLNAWMGESLREK